MRRILLLSVLMAFSLLNALTLVTLQFGENEATYYREFLNLFDKTAVHDEALVTSIVDGDIFTVVRHKTLNFLEVIRLIGVDAPDSTYSDKTVENFGLKCSEFARTLLEDKRILLTFDITNRDSYGRYLAYIWLPAAYEGSSCYVLFNLLALANGYGLAPKSAADFAFLLHGFHFLHREGTMAIIVPHGVLFRGNAEAKIRKKLLLDGNIDAVIGLPANLFYSTGIPVCILVLKKCKKYDDILFINASEHYEKGKRQNVLLPENIDKIMDTYQNRKEEERYSRCVSMEEIEENDFRG